MIRVNIDDPDWSVNVQVTVSGRYNPDVLDDVRRRAYETYREALEAKEAALTAFDEEPMPVGDEPVPEE